MSEFVLKMSEFVLKITDLFYIKEILFYYKKLIDKKEKKVSLKASYYHNDFLEHKGFFKIAFFFSNYGIIADFFQ